MKDLETLVKEYSEVTGITEGYSDSLLQASIKSKDKTVSSWAIPGGAVMCDTKASLIKDIESHIDGTFDDVELTFNITPDDANAIINVTSPETAVVSGNVVNVNAGETVEYTITADGYDDKSGSEKVDSDKSIDIELTKKQVTLTITTTPEEATVKFNKGEIDPDKSITVDYGTDVEYAVSCEGYTEITNNQIVTEDTNVPVSLEKIQVTLTLNVTPEGATILFDDEPSESNSKTVDYGSNVKYNVSLEGYKAVEATESNLIETKTINITLEANDPIEDEGAGMIEAN